MKSYSIALIGLVLMTAGCLSSDKTEISVGQNTLFISPACSDHVVNEVELNYTKVFRFICGERLGYVMTDLLVLEGRGYPLNPGSSAIEVTELQVSIDSKPSIGTLITPEQRAQLFKPEEETRRQLAGRTVFLTPGYKESSTYANGAAEFLLIADYSLKIANDQLTINGKDYGWVGQGATIALQDDRVLINGQAL